MPRKNDSGAAATIAVRITKFGAGKVSTGQHQAGQGDACFAAGEVALVPRDVAEALEARGFGEIQTV